VLVAHALWSPGRGFCFWAEDSRLIGRVRHDDDGLRGRRHPFAVPAEELARALRAAPDAVARSGTVRLTLLLPTSGGRPLPSPPARGATTGQPSRAQPGLLEWVVPGLRLRPGDALELLLRRGADGSGEPGGGVVAGGGWAWCAAVADEALELAARGRAVPAVIRAADGRAEARWMPTPAATDAGRLRALVAAIPPVCRAETGTGPDQRSARPEELFTGALGDLLDAAVRSSLASRRLVPPRRGRRETPR